MRDLTEDRLVLQRVCDQLRSMPESRLVRVPAHPTGAPGSVAAEVHALCCWAVSAQGLPYAVPVLHPLASGDQLAVIGGGVLDWAVDEASGHADSVLEEWRSRMRGLRALL